MTMHARPFAFDQVFAAPSGVEAALEREQLLDEIARLRGELRRVEQRAFAEGEARALESFRAERDTALLSATDALQVSLEAVEAKYADIEAAVVRDAAELALAAADHLAGVEIARDPARIVDEAIGKVLGELRRGSPIEVRVHPDLTASVEAALRNRQDRDQRTLAVTVIGDAALELGDGRLNWERGGAALDTSERRRMLVDELERTLAR